MLEGTEQNWSAMEGVRGDGLAGRAGVKYGRYDQRKQGRLPRGPA